MNDECKIVRDLFPNYIEKLISNETEQFVEKHISTCKECKQIIEDLKKEKIKYDDAVKTKKTVKYLKKYKNKLRVLRIILLIIIVAFVGNTLRKMIILSQMSNKAEEYINSENYHSIHYIYKKDRIIIAEEFVLGDKEKLITTDMKPDSTEKVTIFASKTGVDEFGIDRFKASIYTVSESNKTVELKTDYGIAGSSLQNELKIDNFLNLLLASIHSSIESTTYEGKECVNICSNPKKCYFYDNNMYIDKNTGLVISAGACEIIYRDGSIDRAPARDYIYEFNTVTENDFIEPDISEYEIK